MSQSGIKKGIAYYHCQNREGCGKYCEQVELEQLVAEKFKDLHFSQEFVDMVVEQAQKLFLDKRRAYDGRRQALVNRKTALESRRRVAEDKLFNQVITDDDFARVRTEIQTDLRQINDELLTLDGQRELDIDVAQEVLLLTRNIYQAYTKAPLKLQRQYLAFFWERFEVADGVILNSVSTPLFAELLKAEQAFYKHKEKQKTLDNKDSSDGILTNLRLRRQDSNLEPTPYT